MSPEGELRVPNGELHLVEDVPAAFADLVAWQAGAELDRANTVRDEPSAARERTFRLVLSGGSTARACYERLARRPGLDWARIECLVGDERCVPADDQDANQRMIREALLARVEPHPRFVPMDCDAGPEAYQAVIAARPHLDLVHLGLGPDGHTASLFPGSAALQAPPDRLVARNVDTSGRNHHPAPYAHLCRHRPRPARRLHRRRAGQARRPGESAPQRRPAQRPGCMPIGWSGSATGGRSVRRRLP